MNLKTLHMTNAWHEKSGGVGTFYRALIEAANRHGRFVRLIVPGAKTGVEEAGRFGRIYTVKAPRAPFDPNYRLLMPHRFLFPRTEVHRARTWSRSATSTAGPTWAACCGADGCGNCRSVRWWPG